MTIVRAEHVAATEHSLPLGVARLPGSGLGVDLAAMGFREDEYLITGTATAWTYDAAGHATATDPAVPYTTRILIRRPLDPTRFSGVLQAEPLHPEYDSALTWRMLYPWILRTGAAWVGVTQDQRIADSLRTEFDPQRYAALSMPDPSLRYDIVADAVTAIRTRAAGLWADLPDVVRAYLSGWSMTGSFCRVFLGEGFHERRRLPGGRPVFDGYLIGISSGGAPRAGYPGLSPAVAAPGPGDPRHTIGGHDVPVIELLSELESETHRPVQRPDGDAPDDRYRLYQVAGTAHDTGPVQVTTNVEQYRRHDLPVPGARIVELPSDARLDLLARAVYALLDRWVADGTPPPRADRLVLTEENYPDHPEAARLARDADGNAVGGIRPPWVTTALARYQPHSSPVPEGCRPSPWMPMTDPTAIAWMVGHMTPLSAGVLRSRHPTREQYLERFNQDCLDLVRQGFLLGEDVEPLVSAARQRALWLLS